jgi:hypothetical protein
LVDGGALYGEAESGACVYASITTLWCNRSHYNAEVTTAVDPQAALLQIIHTRKRFSLCHGGGRVEQGRLMVGFVVLQGAVDSMG